MVQCVCHSSRDTTPPHVTTAKTCLRCATSASRRTHTVHKNCKMRTEHYVRYFFFKASKHINQRVSKSRKKVNRNGTRPCAHHIIHRPAVGASRKYKFVCIIYVFRACGRHDVFFSRYFILAIFPGLFDLDLSHSISLYYLSFAVQSYPRRARALTTVFE